MSYRGYWKRNWIHVFRRLWAEMLRDDVFGASAQLAYYFLLAFFPFMVFLVALLAFLPDASHMIRRSDLLEQVQKIVQVMPPAAGDLVRRTVDSLTTRNPALLSLGAVGALLAASNGMRPVMVTLNRAWGVPEGRSYWQRTALALGLTLMLVLLVMTGASLLSLSERLGVWIATHSGGGWSAAWRLGSLVVGYGSLFFIIELIYHVAPNVRRPWRWITPGSVLAVFLWLAGIRLFSEYVSRFGAYEIMYGGLGAVVVFLLWLYIAGLAVLVGGELNAELERSAGIIAVVNVSPQLVPGAGPGAGLQDANPPRPVHRLREPAPRESDATARGPD